ncbi:MAG: type I-C CRISPR-associated protein Cas7/Csd2 [Candidatus Sulfopaludibacter sp.]|nr:type I-C CRISPR-associated protein Cas7/Csd2 [Candidatus Sulfopaludibacter sp.]
MNESAPIDKRYEIVLLFDVLHGNPNGDPDAGNAPRVDPETGYGIVSDVCLKRKIRNFVALTKQYQPPYDIYVKDRGILAREQKRAYEAIGAEPDPGGRANEKARDWMCRNFFDVRTFGAVMTTGKTGEDDATNGASKGKGAKKNQKLWNCGQVRGPVQLGFSRSIAPIYTMEHTITRVALTNPGDTDRAAAETGDGEEKAGSGQMGRKHTIPYALYRAHAFVSPFLARDTGFVQSDLDLLLQSMEHLFDHDRSASRGEMEVRSLLVFEHATALGNAPAHKLFDMVRIAGPATPRAFSEYEVTIPADADLPSGVSLRQIV